MTARPDRFGQTGRGRRLGPGDHKKVARGEITMACPINLTAIRHAKDVYTKHTGNDFHYGRRPVINEGVAETPAMARAKALGLAVNTGAKAA